MHRRARWLVVLTGTIFGMVCQGSSVYNESVNGDLSDNGLSPTALTFSLGSNRVSGTTGRSASGIDRDYFTFTVPTGDVISQFIEVGGTTVGGAVSFLGIEAGPAVTVSTSATDATGLLGWTHYAATATDLDLLSTLGQPALGSSGFSGPLPAGQYSVWIQDFNTGPLPYAFDVQIAAAPEPSTWGFAAAGVALLALWLRSRRNVRAGL